MKGISTAIIALILATTTLLAMLGVFTLYTFYFNNVNTSVITQSYLISLSESLQIETSTLAFKGIAPSYNCFNVSYLIWISSPTKTVTIAVFNTTEEPLSSLFYTLPSASKSGVFYSTLHGYEPVKSFSLSGNIYIPQNFQLLGNVEGLEVYNVSSNSTYTISAIVKPNNVIVIWILYNYEGKWYRLDFTYISPTTLGLGIYIASKTGNYIQSSEQLQGASAPHYVTSQTGDSFGLWFEVFNNQAKASILDLKYYSTGNNAKNVTILLYENDGFLCANISNTIQKLAQLNNGQMYFVNITTGSQLGLSHLFHISVYSQGKMIASQIFSSPSQLNGYNISVSFGSPYFAVGISQAYFVSLQNQQLQSVQSFYNISDNVYLNGFYYNNTENIHWIISNSQKKLYSAIYWDFAYSISNPPLTLNAIMWYWPQSASSSLQTVYIQEIGNNTYIL